MYIYGQAQMYNINLYQILCLWEGIFKLNINFVGRQINNNPLKLVGSLRSVFLMLILLI